MIQLIYPISHFNQSKMALLAPASYTKGAICRDTHYGGLARSIVGQTYRPLETLKIPSYNSIVPQYQP